MLPGLRLKLKGIYQDELFFAPNYELQRVLAQRIPVYLTLKLPGLLTQVIICFPAPFTARVYVERIRKANLVGQVTDKSHIYKAPLQVRYRYGMELLPWMFFGWLDPEIHTERAKRDNVVNYSVLNCTSGHGGVLIRVIRKYNLSEKNQDLLEIYHFEMGNSSNFAEKWQNHPNTKILARFVPERKDDKLLRWQSQKIPVQ